MSNKAVIGIDTSNYTTSVSAVSEDFEILSDRRKLLEVKQGERGLRQQEALFQHVNNLPVLYRQMMEDIKGYDIAGVACSTRPRPVDNSYMPCFNAGYAFADVIASSFRCRVYSFSHQEGHVQAAAKDTILEDSDDFIFFHLSGGTTEAVSMPDYNIVGKTLDISFGQLIDRTGVTCGIDFPCGKEMDRLALSCSTSERVALPSIKVTCGNINLSGIETFCQKLLRDNDTIDKTVFAASLFDSISEALIRMMTDIKNRNGINRFLFAGGVSSSKFIRNKLSENAPEDIEMFFGKPELETDNSVGIAILGGKQIWR